MADIVYRWWPDGKEVIEVFMKIGCCIDIEYYDLLVQNGYDSITLAAKDVAGWNKDEFKTICYKLRNGPLLVESLNSYCRPDLKLTGKGFNLELVAKYTTFLVNRAECMGIRYIGIGVPQSRKLVNGDNYNEAIKQLMEAIYVICTIAKPHGIDVLLESVCSLECNLITTTKEALSIVERLGIDNLHLVYDIYHEYMEKQSLDIINLAGKEIRVVHIAQNKENKRHYLFEENENEYYSYIEKLKEINYNGEICLECFGSNPIIEIQKSYKVIKKILKK